MELWSTIACNRSVRDAVCSAAARTWVAAVVTRIGSESLLAISTSTRAAGPGGEMRIHGPGPAITNRHP